MKLSKKLSHMTEIFVEEFLNQSLLVQKTRDGALGPYHVGLFVHNITMLVKNTPKNLACAIENSVGKNSVFKDYFVQKRNEEVGHDKWGEGDLARLNKDFGIQKNLYVTPSIQKLLEQLDDISINDLPSYIGYIFYVEYLTVIAAPEWIRQLDEKCGVAPKYISIVGNHVELDKQHVQANIQELDEIEPQLGDHQNIIRNVELAIGHFRDFYLDVAQSKRPSLIGPQERLRA